MKKLFFFFLMTCSLGAFAQKGTQIYVGASGTKVLMTGFQQDAYTFPSGYRLSYIKVAYSSVKAVSVVGDAEFWALSSVTGEKHTFTIDTIVDGFWKIKLPGEERTRQETKQLAELLHASPVILAGQGVNYCLGRVLKQPPKELRRFKGIFVCPVFTD